ARRAVTVEAPVAVERWLDVLGGSGLHPERDTGSSGLSPRSGRVSWIGSRTHLAARHGADQQLALDLARGGDRHLDRDVDHVAEAVGQPSSERALVQARDLA